MVFGLRNEIWNQDLQITKYLTATFAEMPQQNGKFVL